MRLKHLATLLGLCALGAGCTPLKQVVRKAICEPVLYCMGMDDTVACCRNRELAEEAWCCFQGTLPDCQYSEDFADGFKAGFAEYVYAGGTGEPPPVPPRQYWKPNYQSPEGQQMMVDWFRGYRHGAAVARESGYRDAVVIPASASLPRLQSPPPPPSSSERSKPMLPADELLPLPKQEQAKPLPPAKALPFPQPLPSGPGLGTAPPNPNWMPPLPPLPPSGKSPYHGMSPN